MPGNHSLSLSSLLVAFMSWWAECPRSTTHSLRELGSPFTLPSGITILYPLATKPLITANSVHNDMYGLSL